MSDMTADDVRHRYATEVVAADVDRDDPEEAHINEDRLAIDVLRQAAGSSPVAAAFIEVYDAHYEDATRWYA